MKNGHIDLAPTNKKLSYSYIANKYKTAAYSDAEFMAVHYADQEMNDLGGEILSLGDLTGGSLSIQKFARILNLVAPSAIVLVHNHPTGTRCEISPPDISLTKEVEKVCSVLDVELIDHIIVSRKRWYSYKENRAYPYSRKEPEASGESPLKFRFNQVTVPVSKKKITGDYLGDKFRTFGKKAQNNIIIQYSDLEGGDMGYEIYRADNFKDRISNKKEIAQRTLDSGSSVVSIVTSLNVKMGVDEWHNFNTFLEELQDIFKNLGIAIYDSVVLNRLTWYSMGGGKMYKYRKKRKGDEKQ